MTNYLFRIGIQREFFSFFFFLLKAKTNWKKAGGYKTVGFYVCFMYVKHIMKSYFHADFYCGECLFQINWEAGGRHLTFHLVGKCLNEIPKCFPVFFLV